MKNANVFVDVDLTLMDANGKPLDGAREGLQRLKDKGCHLFLWSTCGAEYCRKVAAVHGLGEHGLQQDSPAARQEFERRAETRRLAPGDEQRVRASREAAATRR